MQWLFTADGTWDPHLGARIRAELRQGRVVVATTSSGSALVLRNSTVEGVPVTVGVRQSLLHPFSTDGLALWMGRIEATSCGIWAAAGYRSTRPVAVVALEDGSDVGAALVALDHTLRSLPAEGESAAWICQLPAGHPERACGVGHCPVRLRL